MDGKSDSPIPKVRTPLDEPCQSRNCTWFAIHKYPLFNPLRHYNAIMSEGSSNIDEESVSTLREKERELREEAEIAAVGDIEAARERSIEERFAHEEKGHDPFLVSWDGDADPGNPLNFSGRKKALTMVLVGAIAFLTYDCGKERIDS